MSDKSKDFLSPLTDSHILMNKAQAALWLVTAGYGMREIANVVGLPGLLPPKTGHNQYGCTKDPCPYPHGVER
jgi:hypothetical protein